MELERLKAGLEQMEDPRRTNGGHLLHRLEDIMTEYRIATHFGGYLNELPPKRCQNACMTGWDATVKKVL